MKKIEIEVSITLPGGAKLDPSPKQRELIETAIVKIVFAGDETASVASMGKSYTKPKGNKPWKKNNDDLLLASFNKRLGAGMTPGEISKELAETVFVDRTKNSIRARWQFLKNK